MIIALTVSCVMLAACGSHQQPVQEKKEVEAPKSYFPVQDYIKGEIRLIDSTPVGIMRKFTNGARKDSAFIERPEFHRIAQEFTSDQLSKWALEKDYTESSFNDQTTGYFTMTYLPVSANAPYRRIDVLSKPGQLADHVSSIYIEKDYSQGDTIIDEKLFWKANTSFRIIREKNYKGQKPVIEQTLVIWDPSAY